MKKPMMQDRFDIKDMLMNTGSRMIDLAERMSDEGRPLAGHEKALAATAINGQILPIAEELGYFAMIGSTNDLDCAIESIRELVALKQSL